MSFHQGPQGPRVDKNRRDRGSEQLGFYWGFQRYMLEEKTWGSQDPGGLGEILGPGSSTGVLGDNEYPLEAKRTLGRSLEVARRLSVSSLGHRTGEPWQRWRPREEPREPQSHGILADDEDPRKSPEDRTAGEDHWPGSLEDHGAREDHWHCRRR